MTCELRYFFDAGSGICLWAGNDVARERFGYPVDPLALPLGDTTRQALERLIAWYDESIDWRNPAAGSQWPAQESARFAAAARDTLQALRAELPGDEYRVLDEVTG